MGGVGMHMEENTLDPWPSSTRWGVRELGKRSDGNRSRQYCDRRESH